MLHGASFSRRALRQSQRAIAGQLVNQSGTTMGLKRFLRQAIATPTVKQLEMQGELLFDMHLQELIRSEPYSAPKRLERYGFRSFSQNDEDGILQEILRRIGAANRTFVEFGVQDGLQTNTRLLLYQGWRGFWIEADRAACARIQSGFGGEITAGQLQVHNSLVTTEKISGLIDSADVGEIDVLSIDIDGNDYWIWDAIQLKPRVVIIEYNARFHPPTKWVMQYNPKHRWNYSDYHGASLESLDLLARKKGYSLVGCCLAGVNAFFVRNDLVQDQFEPSQVSALYNPPRYYMQKFLASGHPTAPFGPYQSL